MVGRGSFYFFTFLLFYFFKERLCHLERPFSHALPEVVVHLCLMVFERYVADDAEADERRVVYVAGLRY